MNTQAIDAAMSLQRVQKYLDRLAIARGYPKECIHTFIDKDGDEIPLLVADLKVLLQQVTTTSTNTDTPVVPQGMDAEIQQAVEAERERICAAIKAEDDHCVDQGDYMLDSNDCIKIVRGKWVRPDYSLDAAQAKQGEQS